MITLFKPTETGNHNISGSTTTSSGGVYSTVITPSPGTLHFSISFQGHESGSSFLWRYLAAAPFVSFTGLNPGTSTQFYVTVPSGTVLSQVYNGRGGTPPPGTVTEASSGGGQVEYNVVASVLSNGLLIFQPSSFLPASIAITVAALAVVALAALNLFAQGRQLLDTISRQFRSGIKTTTGAIPFLGSRKGFRFRNLFQPRKLLVLFILCALVMVALGAVGGPDPRVKAYVIAADSTHTDEIQSQLQAVVPGGNVQVLTPTQDYTDFDVMSSVGQFNIVVFSDYTQAQWAQEAGFILPYLGNAPIIVIDNRANDTGTYNLITDLYSNQVIKTVNATTLSENSTAVAALKLQLSLNQRTNVLGITLSNGEFKALLAVEAVLSMVLVLLGWAYLGSLTSESRTTTDLYHLAVIIGAGIFVFFFSETIYVVTSSILAVPLSLHAVNSDAHDITAIGLLGFGGGSTPRLAAGFLGVLIGAVGAEGGLRVKKADFALIAGVALILLADPLYVGQYVYQGILLLFPLGNYAFGTAFSNSLSLKGFIYGFGGALGGDVSQNYLLSAGKILFFAGLIPLAYLKRMGRTTAVLALLLVALMIGDGGVRVGEMTPDKTVIAVVPGLVAGFAFAAVILGLAAVEKYVRGNWRSRA
ncbi:MAG: hypothetical protein ABSA72_01235 [Nitrososphaerales archaeon]